MQLQGAYAKKCIQLMLEPINVLLRALLLGLFFDLLASSAAAEKVLLLPTAYDTSHIFTLRQINDEVSGRDHRYTTQVKI